MKLNIGENIRKYRRAMDMTQEQLADKLGVAYQSVSRWENGNSYPDMEFLPVLSRIFSVTVDDLLGCRDSLKLERLEALLTEYRRLCMAEEEDTEAVLTVMREIRRDYFCPAVYTANTNLWKYFSTIMESKHAYRAHPAVMEELRLAADEILLHGTEWLKSEVTGLMVKLIDDDELEGFLAHHATEYDLSKDNLLHKRYRFRGEWANERVLHQKLLFNHVCVTVGGYKNGRNGAILWRDAVKSADVRHQRWVNELQIAFLHAFNCMTPTPAHPVSGDGTVDLWADRRINLGFHQANYLACEGDTEGTFAVLEDAVSLAEAFVALPEGAEIGCNSPLMEGLRLTVHHAVQNGKHYPMAEFRQDSVRITVFVNPHLLHALLTRTPTWHGFGLLSDDKRYPAYIRRIEALMLPPQSKNADHS